MNSNFTKEEERKYKIIRRTIERTDITWRSGYDFSYIMEGLEKEVSEAIMQGYRVVGPMTVVQVRNSDKILFFVDMIKDD